MLVSFNWLREFVEIDLSAHEVAEVLTMGGIEVEGVERVGEGLDKVLTARIEEIGSHPNADTLRIARLTVGAREVSVVCGAPNIEVGRIVPYCPPGMVLPSGMEIKERKVRGVVSPGMICSEKELALGEDASGILLFDGAVETGRCLTEAFPWIDDFILNTSVTPNRGDCLSVLGTAREVAALTGKPWKIRQFTIEESPEKITDKAAVDIVDPDLCPRYVARMVEGVTMGSSPFQVRLRLYRGGLRPISNVVDATNLILLECGQPLHAFDYSLLKGGRIVVRRCAPGETFVTLDGVERNLPENALMIQDAERSVALAGIMGGMNSEIEARTTSVLIESACFERFGIRRTAKAMGMSTEACFRFERGVDPEGTLWAAHRAAYVIQNLAGGKVLEGCIDAYPNPIRRAPVSLTMEKSNSLLGVDLDAGESASYLERLGIEVKQKGKKHPTLVCMPPSWRWDLERDVDMIEEIARVYGFQNIPLSTPRYVSACDNTQENRIRMRTVRGALNSSGFTEVVTMSFGSEQAAREFVVTPAKGGELRLINPLTEDTMVMRTSLLPGLLTALKRNLNFRSEDLKLYEVGKVFLPEPSKELPVEEVRLTAVATGSRNPSLWHFHRGELDLYGKVTKDPEVDFYDMKGALENLFDCMGVPDVSYVPATIEFLHAGKAALVLVGGESVGFVGELSPRTIRGNDLQKAVQVFEIVLEPLFLQRCKESVFRPLPRYPFIERDLSIVVERNRSGDDIKHLISRFGHDIITSVVPFDLYRGEPVPEGYQSVAIRIRYQSEDRTLTDEEVQEVHSRLVEAVTRELGATLRE